MAVVGSWGGALPFDVLSSPAVALVYTEACASKGEALRQERLIKKLKKSAKECLARAYQSD